MLLFGIIEYFSLKYRTMHKHTVYQLNLVKLIFGDLLKIFNWRKFNLAFCSFAVGGTLIWWNVHCK